MRLSKPRPGGTSKRPPLVGVVLAGGRGVRFRPYSTDARPKQFLRITDPNRTMLQITASRLLGGAAATPLVTPQNLFVATNAEHASLVRAQIPFVPERNIVGEPIQRNTAPAIATLMYRIARRQPDAVVVVLPADHFVASASHFADCLRQAAAFAAVSGALVTFGVEPRWPSPDYGYLERGFEDVRSAGVFQVNRFIEKPTVERAQAYLEQGHFFWNSGMFIWQARAFLTHLEHYQPDMVRALHDAYDGDAVSDAIPHRSLRAFFDAAPSISIDYALMEPASLAGHVMMLPLTTYWSDVGTWEGLRRLVDDGQVAPPEVVRQYMASALAEQLAS